MIGRAEGFEQSYVVEWVDAPSAGVVDQELAVPRPAHVVVGSAEPLVGVEPVPSAGLLLHLTPWSVTAVGTDGGAAWRTGRLAVDELRADEVGDGWLLGVADPDDEAREYAVRLRDGSSRGGVGIE